MRGEEPPTTPAEAIVNPQKTRVGVSRMWHAFGYSLAGLRAAWGETAFRQEAIAAMVLLPLSVWLGRSWVETVLLAGSVVFVLVVELLNTAIEKLADRLTTDHDPQIGRVKDMGSAAVGVALVMAGLFWLFAIAERIGVI